VAPRLRAAIPSWPVLPDLFPAVLFDARESSQLNDVRSMLDDLFCAFLGGVCGADEQLV
jgi:hypothetical protein